LRSECTRTQLPFISYACPHIHAHKQNQIQELEGDLKALQEELSSTQMLRREALEECERLRAKSASTEQRLEVVMAGQKSLRDTVAALEDKLAEAMTELQDYPFCVSLTMDANYDTHVRESVSRASFENQLREVPIDVLLRVCLFVYIFML
jgi:hypothetical protein